jgi:hypothetical protein
MGLATYLALLRSFSLQELRLHPWRHAMAVLAVMLGVGLALSVHLINASALSEFSAAAKSASGEPDAQLRAAAGRLDERWLELARAQPQVREASPVLELQTQVLDPQGERVATRLWGVDALSVPAVQPALALQPGQDASRLDIFAPDAVFLNPAAQRLLGDAAHRVDVQIGLQRQSLRRAGRVVQGGAPLLVMDVAALQDLTGSHGHLSRIDLRLQHRLVGLLSDARGAVTGVRASTPNGEFEFSGRNVVLASGGYAANPELWAELTPNAPLCSYVNPYSRGDGLVAARELGAPVDGSENFLATFAGVLDDPKDPRSGAFLALSPGSRKIWEIFVDTQGKRFMQEDHPSIDYRERALLRQPGSSGASPGATGRTSPPPVPAAERMRRARRR